MTDLLTTAQSTATNEAERAQERRSARTRAWLALATTALTDQLTEDFGSIMAELSIPEVPYDVVNGFFHLRCIDVTLTGPSGRSITARVSRMENGGHPQLFTVDYQLERPVLFWTRRRSITMLRAAEILG